MARAILFAALFFLAGCVQLPPTQQEIDYKKFASLSDKSVIYIVRNDMDSREAGALVLDDGTMITTYHGTFYRWEVAPGSHRISGFAGDHSVLDVEARPGAVYYVEYTVMGSPWSGWTFTNLRMVGERLGRRLVQDARLL